MSYLIENSSESESQFIEMALDEQEELIIEQIHRKINKSSVNYFKIYCKEIESEFEGVSKKIKAYKLHFAKNVLKNICEVYPGMIDITAVNDDNAIEIANIIYRFFIKDSFINMEAFVTQYILNQNNRRNLTEYFKETKSTAYTRESYGTKQNYILANNVSNILTLLASSEMEFEDVLKYITKSLDYSGYIDQLAILQRDSVVDVSNMAMATMISNILDSDYEGNLNISLSTVIHEKIIYPTIGGVSIFNDEISSSNESANRYGLIMLRRIENK